MIRAKKIAIVILSILILTLTSCGLYINHKLNSMLNNIEKESEIAKEDANISDEALEQIKEKNVVNIALFGADNSNGGNNGNGTERSDAIKIVSLDFTDKKIKITSLERDVVVYIPGDYNKYGHFNWAYWFGGPELAVKTINYNMDLDITQYVTFSMNAVQHLINLIDGVEVELSEGEAGLLCQQAQVSHLHAGLNTLYGNEAMYYCRLREIGSDFARMDRQNVVIDAIIQKLKNQNLNDLLYITNEMLDYVRTNLSNDDIKSYLMSLLSFDLSNIETYKAPSGEYDDIQNCPGLGGYIVRSYSDMVKEVHMNIYDNLNYKPSQTVIDNEKRTYEEFGEFTKQ